MSNPIALHLNQPSLEYTPLFTTLMKLMRNQKDAASEVTFTEKLAAKGPAFFIIVYGIILFGSLQTATHLFRLLITGEPLSTSNYLIYLISCSVAGLLFGLALWPRVERTARKQRLAREKNDDAEQNQ